MSLILLGVLNAQAAGAGQAYYFTVVDPASGLDLYPEQYVPNAAIGRTNVSSNDAAFYFRYASDGTVDYQATLQSTLSDIRARGYGMARGASADYLSITDEYTGNSDACIAKVDTSTNTISWQKRIGLGAGGSNNFRSFAKPYLDSSENIYVHGYDEYNYYSVIWSYDSSGSTNWQRESLSDSFITDDELYGLNDSTAYVTYRNTESASNYYHRIFKVNLSDGSTSASWDATKFISPKLRDGKLAVDSSENVYIMLRDSDDANTLRIVQFDSGGKNWERKLVGPSDTFYNSASGGYIDSNDNLVITGNHNSPAETGVISFASDGSVNWQKTISGSVSGTQKNLYPRHFEIDDNDVIHLGGFIDTTDTKAWRLTMPADGSIANGTYTDGTNSFTIADGSMVVTTTTDIDINSTADTYSTSSFSIGNSILGLTTSTYSDSAIEVA